MQKKELTGLVVCGGKSTRMGMDKSMIIYHEKAQRYHVYDMLGNFCDRVFLSCNEQQTTDISSRYEVLPDLPEYSNIGPMAALLTAFSKYPGRDFLVVGCDYPLLSDTDLAEFLQFNDNDKIASAFYKAENLMYEPLIAWYSKKSEDALNRMYLEKKYSLQHFLKENNAERYEPTRPENIISVDTSEECQKMKDLLNLNNVNLE